jgi:methyl-accepting chemotaxis protein
MLNRIGIQGKLLSICALLSFFTVIIGIGSIVTLKNVSERYERISSFNLPNVHALDEMLSYYRRSQIYLSNLAISEITPEESEFRIKEVNSSILSYEAAEKRYLDIPFSPGEEELYRPVRQEWDKYKEFIQQSLKSYQDKDRILLVNLILRKSSQINVDYRAAIDKLINFHNQSAKLSVSEAHSSRDFGNIFSVVLMVFGFTLALIIGFLFSSSISKKLLKIASNLSSGADEVASTSTQVATSSEELAASVTQQASALQETASSIEEMSAMVTKNTESCSKSKGLSDQSFNSANNGKQIVEKVIQSIQEIHNNNTDMMKEIERNNQDILAIVKVISEIESKTKVINDIVFQTKLLSFNASVEAARAGEQGKGFAVVAEEVGNLAQMSGNSAKEIALLLEESTKKVELIVSNTKSKVDRLVVNSNEKIEQGSEIAKECGVILNAIVDNVESVNGVVNEISTASIEQDRGIKEISKAVNQLDQSTQQNSTATQQTANAAQQLSHQAEILRSTVLELLGTVNGIQ